MRFAGSIGRVAVATVLTVAGAAVAVSAAGPAAAATCTATWAGPAGGDWATAANWSPAAVPTASSIVCVNTPAAGPTVAAGYAAAAARLQVDGGALRIDGGLRAAVIYIKLATLSGTGQLTSTYGGNSSVLNGVRVDGRLRIKASGLFVTGQRMMCGGQYSLCLNGGSRLVIDYFLYLAGASITGSTTAVPAISTGAGIYFQGDGQTSRVRVDTSAGKLEGSSASGEGDGNTLQLDRWEQLSADGSVDADLQFGHNVVVLARTVTTVGGQSDIEAGALRTVDGLDALRTLSSVSDSFSGYLALPADVTPQDGTLDVGAAALVNVQGAAPVTVHGAIKNRGDVILDTDLTADAFSGSGQLVLADDAALTAATTDLTGPLVLNGTNSSVTASSGLSVDTIVGGSRRSCTRFDADVTMPADGALRLDLGRPDPACPALLSATGSFRLPGTLNLTTASPFDGTQVVVVDAAGGIQGAFAHVRQERHAGGKWTVTYTATQVVATFHTT